MARLAADPASKNDAAAPGLVKPDQVERADKLRLGPARGIALGLALGVAAWALICLAFIAWW